MFIWELENPYFSHWTQLSIYYRLRTALLIKEQITFRRANISIEFPLNIDIIGQVTSGLWQDARGSLSPGRQQFRVRFPSYGQSIRHWPERKLDLARTPIWWQTVPNFWKGQRGKQTTKIRFIHIVNSFCVVGCINLRSTTKVISFHQIYNSC